MKLPEDIAIPDKDPSNKWKIIGSIILLFIISAIIVFSFRSDLDYSSLTNSFSDDTVQREVSSFAKNGIRSGLSFNVEIRSNESKWLVVEEKLPDGFIIKPNSNNIQYTKEGSLYTFRNTSREIKYSVSVNTEPGTYEIEGRYQNQNGDGKIEETKIVVIE